MKKILFFCSFLVLTILISSCSSEKQIAAKPKPKAPEKPIYAVIYYEIVDWGECNNDPTGRFNNAEFYMTVESDLKPAVKNLFYLSAQTVVLKKKEAI